LIIGEQEEDSLFLSMNEAGRIEECRYWADETEGFAVCWCVDELEARKMRGEGVRRGRTTIGLS